MAPPTTAVTNKRKKISSSGTAAKAKPDFKRIKAKVGKRAIKPANVTDTSFKAASIHVRAQTVETATSAAAAAASATAANYGGGSHLFLTSSRGKTLQELASQLHHPAPNVRLSAAKGLHDAVLTVTTTTTNNSKVNTAAATTAAHVVIRAHLVILIPAIGQCLVDETDAVRRLGLNILQQVLRTLSQQQDDNDANDSRSTAATASTTTRALRPFASLLLAFLSLCLNSLDRDVRKDGAMAIAVVARATPALVSSHYVATFLLPALVRLFEDAVFVRQTSSSSSANSAASRNSGSINNNKNKNNSNTRREGSQNKRKSKNKSSSSSISSSNSNQSSSTWHFLLQCLLSVLQTLNADKMEQHHHHHASGITAAMLGGGEPDWIFETGGQAKNVLLIVPGPQKAAVAAAMQWRRRRLHPMRSLPDVALALNQLYSLSSSSLSVSASTTKTTPRLSEKTARQLLEKLRDVFIELTDNNNNIMTTNTTNLDTFLLLSKCLRLLLEQLSTISIFLTEEESSRRVLMQLNGYILQIFPLPHVVVSNDVNSSNNNNSVAATAVVNEINGQLCLTLMSMSGIVIPKANDEKTATMWQGKVFDYIQSSLAELDLTTASNSGSSSSSFSSSSSKHVLDGFRRLFYYCQPCSYGSNDDDDGNNDKSLFLASKQTRLIKAFAKSFFPDSSSLLNLEAARSYTGRQSVGLASMIFRAHDFEMHRLEDALGNKKEDATRTVHGLVDYLVAWSDDYPIESEAVMRLLHAIMIRVSNDVDNKNNNTRNEEEESQDLCTDLRQRLEPIFASSHANDGTISNNASSSCIFERYPEHLQRLMIGLVVTLGPPSKTTLSALARVCGRANKSSFTNGCNTAEESSAGAASSAAAPRRPTVISADVAAFVIHSMYNIRQSIAMADFLTFLLDGMGIIQVDDLALAVTTTTIKTNNNSSGKSQKDAGQDDTFQTMARLVQFDRGVKDASFCLVGCGSQKVLSMLHPLFSRWLEEPAKEPTAKTSTRTTAKHQKELLQLRTALALIAMFSLDMNANSSSLTSIFDCLAVDSFESTVAKSIVRLLQYTPTETTTENEYMILQSWISPIISLITSEQALLPRVFQCITDNLSAVMEEPATHHQQTMMVLQSLLWLCKKPQLGDVLQRHNQNLLQYTSRMEKAVAGGPLERIVGHIIGTVEIHAQQQQK